LLDFQRHDRRHAAGIRLPVTQLQPGRRRETLRNIRQHGCRPRVESGGIRNHDRVGDDCHAPPGGRRRPVVFQRHGEEGVLAGGHASAGAFPRHHSVADGDHDLGEQALGMRRHEIEIERDHRIAGAHTVAWLHAWMKSFPL
jgi:hypothetical protein